MRKAVFWEKLTKPFFVLAPLANVTDAAFRRIIAKYGKPDVLWTEFVSADGLMSTGREHLLPDLIFTPAERPIVAQLFTARPAVLEQAAKLVAELGFDGLDLNMGCPDRQIEKQGAGAALIKTPQLARELIRAARAGAGDLPVSVKTRIGYRRDELDSWLPELLAEQPAAITIHARTRQEMSRVPADWSAVARAVIIRNELKSSTLIIGNGDVRNLTAARGRAAETGADGIMLGRAIFGHPWLFAERQPATAERLRVLVEHSKLFEALLGGSKSFSIMKKHFKSYATDFSGSTELRNELMEARNSSVVGEIVDKFLSNMVG